MNTHSTDGASPGGQHPQNPFALCPWMCLRAAPLLLALLTASPAWPLCHPPDVLQSTSQLMWAGADTQVVTAGTAEAGTKQTREENGRCADSKSGLAIRHGETDGWLAGTETRGMGRLLCRRWAGGEKTEFKSWENMRLKAVRVRGDSGLQDQRRRPGEKDPEHPPRPSASPLLTILRLLACPF